jgi:tRNA A-37 threonylcarbamoyl transferase component Bud32
MKPVLSFGRYRIQQRIASGGMADVYRAITVGEAGFQKEVVLKRMRPELALDSALCDLFIEEAKLAALLSHANIVAVLDFGRIEGEYFIALESVHGRDLRQLLDRLAGTSLLPLEQALHIAAEVARGLDYAHRCRGPDGEGLGLVHSDISPHNILLSVEGEVKIADFGVAQARTRAPAGPGELRGKLAYMSPEQARGEPIDQRSDLFSLGLVLQELCTGQHPYAGAEDVLERARGGEVPAPRRAGEPLPAVLATLLDRCLAREREQRFASAAELLASLQTAVAALPARAGPGELAQAMRASFPEEMAQPVVALDGLVERELGLTPGDELVSAPTLPGGPVMAQPPARRTHRWLLVAVLGLIVLASAGGIYLLRTPGWQPSHRTSVAVRLDGGPPLADLRVPAARPIPRVDAAAARSPDRARVATRPRPERPAGRGVALFRTDPAYAEVWIGGSHRCDTPCTLQLAAGSYSVRLVNPALKRQVTRRVAITGAHTREHPAVVEVSGFR